MKAKEGMVDVKTETFDGCGELWVSCSVIKHKVKINSAVDVDWQWQRSGCEVLNPCSHTAADWGNAALGC